MSMFRSLLMGNNVDGSNLAISKFKITGNINMHLVPYKNGMLDLNTLTEYVNSGSGEFSHEVLPIE